MGITNDGILELKNYIKNNWKYLAIKDIDGNEILRVELTDTDYTNETDSGFVIHKEFSGEEIGVGKVITKTVLYDSNSSYIEKAITVLDQTKINTTQDSLEIDISVSIGGE